MIIGFGVKFVQILIRVRRAREIFTGVPLSTFSSEVMLIQNRIMIQANDVVKVKSDYGSELG